MCRMYAPLDWMEGWLDSHAHPSLSARGVNDASARLELGGFLSPCSASRVNTRTSPAERMEGDRENFLWVRIDTAALIILHSFGALQV